MSLACPQCGKSIDQDFGVVTCSQCQSVLFIDFDGNVKASQDFESQAPEIEMANEEAPEMPGFMGSASELEPAPEQESESEPEYGTESPLADFQVLTPEIEGPEEPNPNENGFQDVADFGNSEQSPGPLAYTVFIENIDTKEIRERLLLALSDSKFQWDAKDLLKQVKMGRLELENLNPVKASILVYRLQDLPVKVSWIQNAYA